MAKRLVKGPVVLTVLDGWGIAEASDSNGITLAKTPNFNKLKSNYPYTTLDASGEHVGLPIGQIGNSEVGHMTIGAGTIIYQDLVRIGKDINNNSFGHLKAFEQAFEYVKEHESQLHIMGLLSTGGVHSHQDHFFALMKAAVQAGVKKLVLHPFLDGRDSDRTEGARSLALLEGLIEELGIGEIATVSGRYYAMDRDKNWDRIERVRQAIFDGVGVIANGKPSDFVAKGYRDQQFDEGFIPVVFNPTKKVETGDAIIFTNFRTDRTKELSAKIMEKVQELKLCFVTMTDYGSEISSTIAYQPMSVESTIASIVSEAGMTQAHLAETEKYAHATYFLNGGQEKAYPDETHILIPSRKDIKTHDEAPEMRAAEICDAAIEQLPANDFIFINFANPDMVGHTANKPAIIVAVETVDRELGRLVDAVLAAHGALVVIADHGNAEQMVDPETGLPHTAHTTNRVPCILISEVTDLDKKSVALAAGGGLKDVAPTVLALLGLEKAESMTGKNLIRN